MSHLEAIKIKIEIYYNATDQLTKSALENELCQLKESGEGLKIAKTQLLERDTTPFNEFYFLSVLDHHKLYDHSKYSKSEINESRKYLWDLLLSAKLNRVSVNKLLGIFVTFIRRVESSERSKFEEILNLNDITLCLTVLKTVAEEVISYPRDQIFVNLLIGHLDIFVRMICSILQKGVAEVSRNNYPSPISPHMPQINIDNKKNALETLEALILAISVTQSFWTDACIEALEITTLSVNTDDQLLALSSLNELLSKAQIPVCSMRYFPSLFQNLYQLISRGDLDDGVNQRVVVMSQHLLTLHFGKLEKESMQTILQAYSVFTLNQTEPEAILQCYEIWKTILESNLLETNNLDLETLLFDHCKYSQKFLIGKKDQGEVVNSVLDTISLVAQIFPERTINYFLLEIYRLTSQLPEVIRSNPATLERKHHCRLLVTAIKVIGRISNLLLESFMIYFTTTRELLNHKLAILGLLLELDNLDQSLTKLSDCLFTSFIQFMPWLTTYQAQAAADSVEKVNCSQLVANVMEISLQFQKKSRLVSIPRLLNFIVINLKPEVSLFPLLQQTIQDLLITQEWSETTAHIWILTTNVFIIGSKSDSSRSAAFTHFMTPIFEVLKYSTSESRELLYALNIASTILSVQSTASSAEKQVTSQLFLQLQAHVPRYLSLFAKSNVTSQSSPLYPLSCHLSVQYLDLFKTQFDVAFVSQCLDTLIGEYKYNVQSRDLQENQTKYLFDFLKIIAGDKTRRFDSFLPSIISFTIQVSRNQGRNEGDQIQGILLVQTILSNNVTRMAGSDSYYGSMEVLTNSLKSSTPDVVRVGAAVLTDLNDRYRLFSSVDFKSRISNTLLSSIFDTIRSKYLNLLKDELSELFVTVIGNDYATFQNTCANVNFAGMVDRSSCLDILSNL